jgi:hypothetical protein
VQRDRRQRTPDSSNPPSGDASRVVTQQRTSARSRASRFCGQVNTYHLPAFCHRRNRLLVVRYCS